MSQESSRRESLFEASEARGAPVRNSRRSLCKRLIDPHFAWRGRGDSQSRDGGTFGDPARRAQKKESSLGFSVRGELVKP